MQDDEVEEEAEEEEEEEEEEAEQQEEEDTEQEQDEVEEDHDEDQEELLRDIPAQSHEADPSGIFVAAATFAGRRPGFVFKAGRCGLGYYRDELP